MTEQKYRETNIELQALKVKIRTLEIGSPGYNVMLFDIKILDNALKLHDASIPTYSGHTKLK